MALDRVEINRALAKALAYKQCGKEDLARQWARTLITRLELAEILLPDALSPKADPFAHMRD